VSYLVAFALGAALWWAFNRLAWHMVFGGRKIGSQARQRWLAKLDYQSLLRIREQIDGEIQRRQP
jgi:hypothetical protein